MAQAPRTGVNKDGDLIFPKSHPLSNLFIKDLCHVSDFNKMVSRTDGSQLVPSSFHRPIRDLFRISAPDTPSLLGVFKVARGSIPPFHGPSGSLSENLTLFFSTEPKIFPMGT